MASRHQPDEDAEQGAAPVPPPPPPNADVARTLPLDLETSTSWWPPFRLRRYAGGFWLPEATAKEGLAALSSCFAPRPTDASFPKSGTTWLKALAFATLHRSTHPPSDAGHPLRHRSPHECVRFLGIQLSDATKHEFEALPSPRLLATHLPYSLLPGAIAGDCRVVYVCREPKDTLVSYWLFTRKLAAAPPAAATGVNVVDSSFTMQEALELFCDGRCPSGPQWLHVLQYWEESLRRPDRVLFLRYEEMLRHPEAHVKKLAKFMGCEFSEEEEEGGVVSAIVELCSLGKLRDMEVNRNGSTRMGTKNESFFRKGVAGDWSEHMTPEMAQRLDKVVQDALQGTGFAFATTG